MFGALEDETRPPCDRGREIFIRPLETEGDADEPDAMRALRNDEGDEGAVVRAPRRRDEAAELAVFFIEGEGGECELETELAIDPAVERVSLLQSLKAKFRVNRAARCDPARARAGME